MESRAIAVGAILMVTAFSFAQEPTAPNSSTAKCSSNENPYRDFDFILGTWEFRSLDGQKLGDQVITRRGDGCGIVEEWTEKSGITGVGISFVDPANARWRQVWISSRFHIDYSGGLDENGAMVLEGWMYPTNGKDRSKARGVWTKQGNGSVKKEFMTYDEKNGRWTIFFTGFAFPQEKSSAETVGQGESKGSAG